jgi:hypothetical protein
VCSKLGNVSKEVRAQPTKTCILIRLWAQHTNQCEPQSIPSLVSLSTTKSSFSATRILQATIMDQGGSFGGFKIYKLTASNYHTWKQKIELVLAFRELDEVVFNAPSPSSGKRMQRPRPSSDSLSAMNIWNMSVGPNLLPKCGWPSRMSSSAPVC